MGNRKMTSIEEQIQRQVDAETEAWNSRDADALVSLFHPDMVWPWPPNSGAHDPAGWVMPFGRFNRERWKAQWEELFRTHDLVQNLRRTVCIVVSEQGDAGFAVVDVDTLWRNRATGEDFRWKGRACKGYTRVRDHWLLSFHTGLLDYEGDCGQKPPRSL